MYDIVNNNIIFSLQYFHCKFFLIALFIILILLDHLHTLN